MTVQPGEQIGRFRIEEQIGKGGQASVYVASDSRSPGLRRAIKVLHAPSEEDEDGRGRFLDEAELLQGLDHEHIVRVHDSGAEGGRLFTVVDYVTRADGKPCNLREYIRDHSNGAVPPRLVHKWACQIAEALSYAHCRGVLHRDIKPSNLLLDKSDDIKLVDFGLAKLWKEDVNGLNTLLRQSVHPDSFRTIPVGGASATGGLDNPASGIMGSLEYMAPEQFKPDKKVDHRADIYAVGVVLYRLLTGRMNGHINEPASHVVSGLDETWDRIIFRCTKYDANDRYSSADELLEALQDVETPETAEPDREDADLAARRRARLEAVVQRDLAICREGIDAQRPRDVRHYLAGVSRARASLWALALQNGIPGAFWLVGKCCELGVHVEGPNRLVAWKWYNEAHRRGLRLASYTIAGMLQAAPHPMNLRQAFKFYLISAGGEDALAAGQFEVGTCYRFGLGVRRSRRQARKWLARAQAGGFPEAPRALRELRSRWRMVASATAMLLVLAIGASLALPAVYEPQFERRVSRACKRVVPPHDAGPILKAGMSGLRYRREGLVERGRRADRLWRAYNPIAALGQYLSLRPEVAEFTRDIGRILNARPILIRADELYRRGEFRQAVESVRPLTARTPDLESMVVDALEPLAKAMADLRDPNKPLPEIARRVRALRFPTGYSREPADRLAAFVDDLEASMLLDPCQAVARLGELSAERPDLWTLCPRAQYLLCLSRARNLARQGHLDDAGAEIDGANRLGLGLGDDARNLWARLELLGEAWSIEDEAGARKMLAALADPNAPHAEADDIAACLRGALDAWTLLRAGDYARAAEALRRAREQAGQAGVSTPRIAASWLDRLGYLLDPPDRLVLALGFGQEGRAPVTMELRLIRAARLDPTADRPTHPYYLGATEVSQAQWEALGMRNDSFQRGPNEPVVNVTWDIAGDFCRRLETSARIARAEWVDAGERRPAIRRSWTELIKDGWRPTLPDSNEWWFAYRGGEPEFPGSLRRLQARDAKTNLATKAVPRPVSAGRDGNLPYVRRWGLTGMAGNVREWCRYPDGEGPAIHGPGVYPACGGSFLEATGAVERSKTFRLPADLGGEGRLRRHRRDTGLRVCLRWAPPETVRGLADSRP